jgi:hypothetical protein
MLSKAASQRSVVIVSSVAEVLFKLKLSQHEESFAIHCIDTYTDLQMLKEEQMRELGMWKVGERNRLMRWIAKNLGGGERRLTDDAADMTSPPLVPRAASSGRPPLQQSAIRRRSFTPAEVVPMTPSDTNQVTVSGAGLRGINGVYEPAGMWDGVRKYSKSCFWKGKHIDLLLFRCPLMNDTRRWFISIVPIHQSPGTNVDTDFYSSPMVQDLADEPPEGGWAVCQPHGVTPPPTLECYFGMSLVDDDWTPESTSAIAESVSRISQTTVASPVSRIIPPPPPDGLVNQKIMLESAGSPIINGVYTPRGGYDGVMIYKKGIYWEGRRQTVSLFRCIVRGNQKRWYVSFVPEGSEPGTSLDTDYYSAPVSADRPDLPPRTGWTEAEEGLSPSPKIIYLALHGDESAEKPGSSSGSSGATVVISTPSTVSTDHAVRVGHKNARVQGASLTFINGVYSPSGTFDGVPKFKKYAFYKGRDRILTLFRCLVKGNKKRWYISIVPSRSAPGTVHDTDFYTAPALNSVDFVPPHYGWVAVGDGRGEAPTVVVDDNDSVSDIQEASNEETEESKDDKETRSSDNDDEIERIKVTPKASGSRKTMRWNPLCILTNKDSKSQLSLAGIDVEELKLPSVVTVNGKGNKDFQPISI